MEQNEDIIDYKARLFGSLTLFTETFYKLRTGREFVIGFPVGRESHILTISRELTKVFRLETNNPVTIINVPPRYGKSELLIHFVAWIMARYPDSQFLYVSYSHTLASKQTQTIREIMSLPAYRKLFDVHISDTSSAKDNFETTVGGSVYAAGMGGTITGRGAGIRGVTNRFSGAFVIDDAHKPDEATSDIIRQGAVEWFYNTAMSRLNNGDRTPILFIGQRVHEDDLPANLLKNNSARAIVIPALDAVNNALDPSLHTKEALFKMKEESPYVFAAQYQQDPQPAGGGIFKIDWFPLFDNEPKILGTFITADTAETEKTYNDKTVFSFWGIYKIKHGEVETDMYGLHWLDCVELSVEPKDLESEFMAFYSSCMQHSVKPKIAAIEKKSTGVTLVSILNRYQGLMIMPIERNRSSGSKSDRFLAIQSYVATKRVSLPFGGKHTKMCLEHVRKITANNSHRFDDIADTMTDAVDIALVKRTLMHMIINPVDNNKDNISDKILNNFNKLQSLRASRY